jgi:hypothetical protein
MGVGQTITVVVPEGPPPTSVPVSAGTTLPPPPVSGNLPRTGAPLLPLLLCVALALIIAGRLLVGMGRRLSRTRRAPAVT